MMIIVCTLTALVKYLLESCNKSHDDNDAILLLALLVVKATLCNRAGHYIFALWFLSFFFFVSDIAIFVLKKDVKLQLTNSFFFFFLA